MDIHSTAVLDKLMIDGAANLAGLLKDKGIGVSPTPGTRYALIDYSSRTGAFSSIQSTGFPGGQLVPEYNNVDQLFSLIWQP
ncbi:MAG: hypothetical protein K2W96_03370 [Gemmataceae bacterium]|nr:hypothetical protein [Gemmataceae bacterium]